MTGLTLRVHETRRIPGSTQVRQVRALPYIRFSQQGEAPVFVQDGKFYADEADKPMVKDEVPGWVQERVELLTPEGRLKVGLATESDIKALKKVRRSGRNLAASKPRSIEDIDAELDLEKEDE